MTTTLFWHPACREHTMGAGHPEQPARLDAVLVALEDQAFSDLNRVEAPRAEREHIARCHPASHIDAILGSVPENGIVRLDADTALSTGSAEAVLRAAGAVVAAVDTIMTGKNSTAFCAVRPPGHHAEPNQPMGFCLFNNIAIGAHHALAEHQAKKIAVIDFDVHHGNGTQAMFQDHPNLFFASSHQMPLYPGTGLESERGVAGNIVNVALPPGAGPDEFRIAFNLRILPALRDFDPDLVMISAGFDAHRDDPLANLSLLEDDYYWATAQLLALADDFCDGRVVSVLEGGYDLGALGRSAAAHVKALMRLPF